jgi:hypothetical protein
MPNFVPGIKGRLRMFGNRVLRRIFEPRRDEVEGGWSFINCTLRQV